MYVCFWQHIGYNDPLVWAQEAKLMGWVIAALNIKLQHMGLPDPKKYRKQHPS